MHFTLILSILLLATIWCQQCSAMKDLLVGIGGAPSGNIFAGSASKPKVLLAQNSGLNNGNPADFGSKQAANLAFPSLATSSSGRHKLVPVMAQPKGATFEMENEGKNAEIGGRKGAIKRVLGQQLKEYIHAKNPIEDSGRDLTAQDEQILEEVAEIMVTSLDKTRQEMLLMYRMRKDNALHFAIGLRELARLRQFLPFICYTNTMLAEGGEVKLFAYFSFAHVKSQFLGMLQIDGESGDEDFQAELDRVKEELNKAMPFFGVLFPDKVDVIPHEYGGSLRGRQLQLEVRAANELLEIARKLLASAGEHFYKWESDGTSALAINPERRQQIHLPLPKSVMDACKAVPGAPGEIYVEHREGEEKLEKEKLEKEKLEKEKPLVLEDGQKVQKFEGRKRQWRIGGTKGH